MSYLSFENNIIEASGNLILKSTNGVIDCSNATISNVTIEGTIKGSDKIKVTSIEASLNDISFNGSNLLDVSFIQVNNDVSCSSLLVDTIGSTNHDISFNGSNLLDVSFIQVNNEISCSSLKVENINSTNIVVDGSLTVINTIDLDISDNIIGLNRGHTGNKNTSGMLINYEPDVSNIFFGYHKDEDAFVIADTSYNHDDVSRNIVVDKFVDLKVGNTTISNNNPSLVLETTDNIIGLSEIKIIGGAYKNKDEIDLANSSRKVGQANLFLGERHSGNIDVGTVYGGGIRFFGESFRIGDYTDSSVNYNVASAGTTVFYRKNGSDDEGEIEDKVFSYKYDSNDVTFTGQITALSFNATSDYRTKTNIEELDENITVSNLRPLVYLKNGKKEIGLLAHELQEVYPFMVCGEKDGKEMQSVNYIGLIGVLINDVKRLTNENQILKLNNDTLKSDYDTLKSDYNTLKSRLDSLEDKFNKKFE